MAELLSLRSSPLVIKPNDIPNELKRKKRGKKGGVKVRNKKRGFKPYLPSFITGNVQSLDNKMDELWTLTRHDQCFRTCSVMTFTETWLLPSTSDETVGIDGFKLFRCDRDLDKTVKQKGGGVCTYINTKWCNPKNCHEKYKYSDPNIEMLTISARPYYLPREISHVIMTSLYMPPDSNYSIASQILSDHISTLQTQAPDALQIVTGDFNQCVTTKVLPGFQQLVTEPTRGNSILDLFFTNTKESHTSVNMFPVGNSDHTLVYLRPKYTPQTKREPPTRKTVLSWSDLAWENLQDCLASTDWSVFIDATENVSELADTVCNYINFCVSSIVPVKTIKIFSNNKPWVSKDIKDILNRKKIAFNNKNKEEKKVIQKELKCAIKKGKGDYKKKIEKHFKDNDMKRVWDGMNIMSRRKNKSENNTVPLTHDYANDLNAFYARFDSVVF